jgi:hypothetical protein
MQTTQISTQVKPQHTHLVLQLREEVHQEPQIELKPFIERLRVTYHQHAHCNDELSQIIQDIAGRFILIDFSKITQASEMIRIAQDCRTQFARVLCSDFNFILLKTDSDFDQALMENPIVLRGWKFDEKQICDFIKLDKQFGQRSPAISPFDRKPIPEVLPKHEFAQAIVNLLKTIPQTAQNSSQAIAETQADDSIELSFQRWSHYKKFANCTVQFKKNEERDYQFEIDRAARKLDNEKCLHELINHEVQKAMEYIAEREKEMQVQREEAEQALREIKELKTELNAARSEINKISAALAVEEKKSEDLQQQLYVQQMNYARLAQELQNMRQNHRKRPWWQFW